LEETGYASDDWQHLGSFVVDANRRVNVSHFFLARNARHVAAPRSDDLEQFVFWWADQSEVRQALRDGRVGVISHAANLALALLTLGEEIAKS
jgi:ADP-ribose diphosphatase